MLKLATIARLTLAAALLVPGVAQAENWEKFVESESGVIFWIDRDSIGNSGQYRKAWTMADYTNVPGDEVGRRKALEEYDCGAWSLRPVRIEAYGRNGTLLRSVDIAPGEAEWQKAGPGSIAEAKLELVCPKRN